MFDGWHRRLMFRSFDTLRIPLLRSLAVHSPTQYTVPLCSWLLVSVSCTLALRIEAVQ